MNIQQKIIMITGSSGTIGSNLLLSFENENKIIALDKKIPKKKFKNVFYHQCDLNDRTSRKKEISKIKKKFKKIDIIINCAGFTSNKFRSSNIKFQNNKLWDKFIEINLTSIFDITCELKSNLLKSKNPLILNVCSIHSEKYPDWNIYKNTKTTNLISYSVSKGGLLNMTKWLATYLAPKIRVNAISPGGIKKKQSKIFIKNYENKTPLKRMCKVEDIIFAARFLCDERSNYINGHNLIVDGGYSLT